MEVVRQPCNSNETLMSDPLVFGNPWGVQIIRDLFVKEDPVVVFLQKTKVLASFFDFLASLTA